MIKISIVSCIIIFIVQCSYKPQMTLATSKDFFNKQINTNVAPIVDKLANTFAIKNQTFDKVIQPGVHLQFNLTNITQHIAINWNANIMNITGNHSFTIEAKNINVTLNAKNFSYYIVTQKVGQHGELDIVIESIDIKNFINFEGTNCKESIGFGVSLSEMRLDSSKLKLNITFKNKKDHPRDKWVIGQLEKIILNRIENIINTNVRKTLNELLHNTTCTGLIKQILPFGHQSYILTINTTQVPYFNQLKFFTIPLDINFQNERTNETNEQVDNENLVDHHLYQGKANVTASISSNMIDTILWLVDDSNFLSVAVNKDTLGPDAPISLDTNGLSILLPGLKKYGNKDMIVRVNTSSQYSQMFIRSGRLLAGLSISADFIVNDTGKIQELDKCLEYRGCFIATTLNITLGLSTSIHIPTTNIVSGLIQSLYVDQIKVIKSLIEVKTQNLMKIINPLISSARPQLNYQLQQGIQLNITAIDQLKKLNVTGVMGDVFLDYASFGVLFDI